MKSLVAIVVAVVALAIPADATAEQGVGTPQARILAWDQVEVQWDYWGRVGEYGIDGCDRIGARGRRVACDAHAEGLDDSGEYVYFCRWQYLVRGRTRNGYLTIWVKHTPSACELVGPA